MRKACALMGLALAVGCGDSKPPSPEAVIEAKRQTERPAADEAKAVVAAYLAECGLQDVQIARLAEQSDIPKDAHVLNPAWAYTFTASYTTVLGEKQTCEDWLVVMTREEGKPTVRRCFDTARKLVGGHRGGETAETAAVISLPPQ